MFSVVFGIVIFSLLVSIDIIQQLRIVFSMKPKPDTKFTAALRTMPRLRHSLKDGLPFEYSKSEVIHWLASNMEVMAAVFDMARSSGRVIHDSIDGTWRGATEAESAEIRRLWREGAKK